MFDGRLCWKSQLPLVCTCVEYLQDADALEADYAAPEQQQALLTKVGAVQQTLTDVAARVSRIICPGQPFCQASFVRHVHRLAAVRDYCICVLDLTEHVRDAPKSLATGCVLASLCVLQVLFATMLLRWVTGQLNKQSNGASIPTIVVSILLTFYC